MFNVGDVVQRKKEFLNRGFWDSNDTRHYIVTKIHDNGTIELQNKRSLNYSAKWFDLVKEARARKDVSGIIEEIHQKLAELEKALSEN